jgi:hypothetical protein
MSASANKFYVEKYHWLKENWPEDERMTPFWSRMPDHLLRIAMLLSISEDVKQRESITVGLTHVEQANALLEWMVGTLPRLYAMLGMNEYGDNALHVVEYLYRRGGTASHAELSRAVMRYMSKRALKETVAMLGDAKYMMKAKKLAPDGTEQYILLRGPEEM